MSLKLDKECFKTIVSLIFCNSEDKQPLEHIIMDVIKTPGDREFKARLDVFLKVVGLDEGIGG